MAATCIASNSEAADVVKTLPGASGSWVNVGPSAMKINLGEGGRQIDAVGWAKLAAMTRAWRGVMTAMVIGAACAAPASNRPAVTVATPTIPSVDDEIDEGIARAEADGSLKSVPESERWRIHSFFSRVRHQVQLQWHPDEALRRLGAEAAGFGNQRRLTIVLVRLTPNGDLIQALIHRSSGVRALDDEAIQAFKKATPLGESPKALLDFDGLISFTFGFLYQHPLVDGGQPLVDGAANTSGGDTKPP